jgi:hypothetical protein
VVHNNFKTSNVLVDENFIAKVADAGIIRLIQGSDNVGPSNRPSGSIHQDPEYDIFCLKLFPTTLSFYFSFFPIKDECGRLSLRFQLG